MLARSPLHTLIPRALSDENVCGESAERSVLYQMVREGEMSCYFVWGERRRDSCNRTKNDVGVLLRLSAMEKISTPVKHLTASWLKDFLFFKDAKQFVLSDSSAKWRSSFEAINSVQLFSKKRVTARGGVIKE